MYAEFRNREICDAVNYIGQIYEEDHNQEYLVLFPTLSLALDFSDRLKDKYHIATQRMINGAKIYDSRFLFLPIGSGDQIKGLRPHNIIVCYHEGMPKDTLNIVLAGFRCTSSNPIEEIINKKVEDALEST